MTTVIAFSSHLIFLGHHVKAPVSVEEIERKDPRAPVLYLRPFIQEKHFFVIGLLFVQEPIGIGAQAYIV